MLRQNSILKQKKEIQRLSRENASLKKQVQFLAEKCLEISREYGQVTYGGCPIYKAPFKNVDGWLDAAKKQRIVDDEIEALLKSLREL